MLSLVLGSTTHSFELMLSAFITGLAFGGLWIKRRIDNIQDPVAFSGSVQLLMGIVAIMTLPIYFLSFDWMQALMGAVSRSDSGFVAFSVGSHLIALAVMLPATFLAGMTLPLFTHVLLCKGAGEKAIGRVYAANTLGAIVGVLFAIHIGLPLLGLKSLIAFGASLDIVLGLFLLNYAYSGQRRTRVIVHRPACRRLDRDDIVGRRPEPGAARVRRVPTRQRGLAGRRRSPVLPRRQGRIDQPVPLGRQQHLYLDERQAGCVAVHRRSRRSHHR